MPVPNHPRPAPSWRRSAVFAAASPIAAATGPDASRPGEPPAEACDVFVADLDRVTARRRVLVSPDTAAALSDTFRALGDPTRVRMLDALAHGELCVCDLAAVVGMSESAVSHQLRLLRALRLVRGERRGRQVFYALDDQHILDLVAQGRRHVEEGGRVEGHGPSGVEG
jgi:ArsR family transcriptional regulator